MVKCRSQIVPEWGEFTEVGHEPILVKMLGSQRHGDHIVVAVITAALMALRKPVKLVTHSVEFERPRNHEPTNRRLTARDERLASGRHAASSSLVPRGNGLASAAGERVNVRRRPAEPTDRRCDGV